MTRVRDAILADITRRATEPAGGADVIAGDFNVTRSSPAYKRNIAGKCLRSTGSIAPMTPSWFSRIPFLGLRIDHVVVNKSVEIDKLTVEDDIGSDHYLLYAEVRF